MGIDHPRTGKGTHYPRFILGPPRRPPPIQIMSAREQGLDPQKLPNVPAIKNAMREGRFDYLETENRISGLFHELTNMYLLAEGHHRLLAAVELAAETGDWTYFNALVDAGNWNPVDRPVSSVVVPLPVRPFSVPAERQKEMNGILKAMEAPLALRLYWNWGVPVGR